MKRPILRPTLRPIALVLAAFGAALLALAAPAAAEDAGGDDLRIRGLIYGWGAGVEGDLVFRNVPADIDVRFCDIVDTIQIAGMGRLEAWKGRFGATLDGLYLDLEDESDEFVSSRFGKTEIEVETELREAILELGGGVRFFEVHPVTELHDLAIAFEALAGGRYWYLKIRTEVDIERTGTFGLFDIDIDRKDSRSRDWVEPFVGGRAILTPVENVALYFRFDFGGFGIGSAADHTVNVVTGIEWSITEHVGLAAGYRYLRLDYTRGSGRDRISVDLDFTGPAVGMTFTF